MYFKVFAEQDDQIQVSSQRFPVIARLLFSTFSIDDTVVKGITEVFSSSG